MIGGAVVCGRGASSNYKPGKCAEFGNFNCVIQLEPTVVGGFPTLRGRVIIENAFEIRCCGLRVQLDANVSLRFETKVDYRTSAHKKLESVLKGASDPGADHYIESPVKVDITKVEALENENDPTSSVPKLVPIKNLQPGNYSAPFSLTWPNECLPASFSNQYGHLYYKVVAYMKSQCSYVQIAEHVLKFGGYNNCRHIPCDMPLQHESGFKNSVFSSKKVLLANMLIEKGGFLPGEDLPFSIKISNEKSFTIRCISVNLVRRNTYDISGAKRSTLVNVDSYECNEVTRDEEITCNGKLKIPRNCVPSYNVKQVYSVIYLVQYQVKVTGYAGPLKGELEVIVGTTNESLEKAALVVGSDGDQLPYFSRRRSGSVVSRLSDTSVRTTLSLPPGYSQLSSRATSMNSLTSFETLPPHYDDIA